VKNRQEHDQKLEKKTKAEQSEKVEKKKRRKRAGACYHPYPSFHVPAGIARERGTK
jgi:hypothetical protein